MTRPLRIQYPGAVYHVTCRGNERRKIYHDDTDRIKFLEILAQTKGIYTVKIHGYVLMSNHFHLLTETPLGNLGEFMRRLNVTYTSYYNRRHGRVGHLYQGRYKSLLADKDEYVSVLSRYIHLNPVRIRAFKGKTDKEKVKALLGYRWSSLPGFIDKGKAEDLVDYDLVLAEHGGDNLRGRRSYKDRILEDLVEGMGIRDEIIGQSVLGGDHFVSWLKDQVLSGKKDRERPSLQALNRYCTEDVILGAIEKATGKGIAEIKFERGVVRQIAMDLLYRIGGLKGVEIGRLLGVDYSTVSQGRKRLMERIQRDPKTKALISRLEKELSR